MTLFVFIFHPGPIGLDWDTLKETLNLEFNWEAAVQGALGTDDTLEEVRCSSSFVNGLNPGGIS